MAMAWQSPLGYGRLALGYGCAWLGATWAWLWPLDLAINGYGLVPPGYDGFGLAPLG